MLFFQRSKLFKGQKHFIQIEKHSNIRYFYIMKHTILVINTAIDPIGFCLRVDHEIRHHFLQKATPEFTENISLHIKQACETQGIELAQLTALGVISGPGSYTGLRIGMSCMKTFAQVLEIPIYSHTSFQQIASQIPTPNMMFAVILAGKKKHVTLQLFNGGQKKSECSEPVSLSEEECYHFLTHFNAPISVYGCVGNDVESRLKGIDSVDFASLSIDCVQFSHSILDKILCKEKTEWDTLVPFYCYEPTIGKIKSKKNNVLDSQ
ncbi:tRNA (adenosine(37)-N6)-threonylcarbamoyltransferase complex dimerization subunit type 1 TsaB [Candidatus Marinamargulisbacteria bacterium SCGC AG-343-D04]|nr:tRNA (adenosine(37)-N6)-threonylcarbamoyltransferase complex dimerization subunit type 1 TsaB [Candidatus Marinamargulisbacteria bacterium SCGC AG-343-D04]